jgi:DNA polymerase
MWEWASKKNKTLGLSQSVYVACEVLKHAWREAHPATVALWASAKDAVTRAIQQPGVAFNIGPHLKARRDGAWLRLRLPSGRYLCYLNPRVDDDQISYMGVNQYTRQWARIKTYGGKLVENATQAAARDVLAENMPHVEASGFRIVLTVHDELLTEAPDSRPDLNPERLAALMTRNPFWAHGLPLAAAGFECTRYRKD